MRLQQCDSAAGDRQRFQTAVVDGRLVIANEANEMLLDVAGMSSEQGAGVVVFPAHYRANQLWELVEVEGGQSIVSVNSGLCLEVRRSGQIEQRRCDGSGAQAWNFSDPSDQ